MISIFMLVQLCLSLHRVVDAAALTQKNHLDYLAEMEIESEVQKTRGFHPDTVIAVQSNGAWVGNSSLLDVRSSLRVKAPFSTEPTVETVAAQGVASPDPPVTSK